MNKWIIIILVGFFQPLFCQSNTLTEFEIIGKWNAEDESGFGSFTFDEEGYTIIETEGTILGGKKFERNGKEFSLKYKIDYNTNPIELDLTFTGLKDGQQLIWYFILKINNQNEIVIARGMDGKRPDSFIESDYIILNRVE
ncbi:MAG: hypothetical protein NXH73_06410 [Flavobacteriaceae bacterium]|nr:hypothetical protein [Flavobacteriaceae bacterium]